MSPGAFYHPSPNMGHVWNVAPGAPLQMHHSPVGSPGSPGFYAAVHVPGEGGPGQGDGAQTQTQTQTGVGLGMGDYFSAPSWPSEGYFPPVSALRSSGLANEITREGEGESSAEGEGGRRGSDRSVPATTSDDSSASSSDLGLGRARSSAGTSLDGGDAETETEAGMRGFASLGLDERELRVGGRGGADAMTQLPNGEMREWEVAAPSERRASWTPELTRAEFRRGLAGP